MALNFNIIFNDQSNFQFIDNSAVSDYSDLGSYAKTRLEITYPKISDGDDAETANIVPENILLVDITDNFIFNTTTDSLPSLKDGVYKFKLIVLDSGDSELGTLTKYFVQGYSIQQCIKSQVEDFIEEADSSCSCGGNKISLYDAILHSAEYEASQDEFTNSQVMIDYLTSECIKLGCSC